MLSRDTAMASSPPVQQETLLGQPTNNNNACPTIHENTDESDSDCDSPRFLKCPGIPPLCGQIERTLHLSRQDTLDSPLMEEDEDELEDATSLTSADSFEALRPGSSATLPARGAVVSSVKPGDHPPPPSSHHHPGLDRFAHFTIKKQTSYR